MPELPGILRAMWQSFSALLSSGAWPFRLVAQRSGLQAHHFMQLAANLKPKRLLSHSGITHFRKIFEKLRNHFIAK